ncbi:aminotransferase class V-fold PLP-dependent enzyme [Bifidobacterium sp. ESL0775]|uniref:aminotransferase class V-fold PLP-dependent enzyme n=1 Tax=Bifidobacterium sp. ESL0775 TaxID=2983230 RepID=UPI0023F74FD8|nr:aminotransferase class V-fold PLP-dependent enzyme [Bifidobacterium sp. ESL0775]WEV69206.1 aminotransferase class V-fold PLP-dependent enzyme [Bifidobacterium sp. ESL0775]
MNTSQEEYLQQFHEGTGYLNFSGIGPISEAAIAINHQMDIDLQHAKVGTAEDLSNRYVVSATQEIAQYIGVPTNQIAMQPNTSEGLFQAAFSLGQIDGHVPVVLLNNHEFPSNFYPWKRAESAGLLKTRTYSGDATAENIRPYLDGVDVLALSAVDFQTGFRVDLDEIREAIGDRLLVVDGIQAFGASPMDWKLADVLLVGGQKWLRAGWGSGFMYCSQRALERCDKPLLSGWFGTQTPHLYDALLHDPAKGIERFSITALDPMASGRLSAAMHLVNSVGVEWIFGRINDFALRLGADVERLGGRLLRSDDPRHQSTVLPLSFEGKDPAGIGKVLTDAGIVCSVHPKTVRISPHATSSQETYDLLVTSLSEALKQ